MNPLGSSVPQIHSNKYSSLNSISYYISTPKGLMFIANGNNMFMSTPKGFNVYNKRKQDVYATPIGVVFFTTQSSCYKHLNPLGSSVPQIHSNKYSSLNSISYFLKNSKYSCLNVLFLWCSFWLLMYVITLSRAE